MKTPKLILIIREINQKILKTSPEDIKCFLDETLSLVGYKLNKTHFKNKNDWKEFRERRKEFLEKHICNDSPIEIREDCFQWIDSKLSQPGVALINAMIKYINDNLIETTYYDDFNITNYKKKLEWMGFTDEMGKISFNKIKEQYAILFDRMTEKELDELNGNFLYLRDNYEKYLKEILRII